MMKLTRPQDIKGAQKETIIGEMIKLIEEQLNTPKPIIYKDSDGEEYISVFIKGNYDKGYRNVVADHYLSAGWALVNHKSSEENGELPGMIKFMFYFPNL